MAHFSKSGKKGPGGGAGKKPGGGCVMDDMDDDLDAQGGSQELPDTGEEFDEIPGGNGEEGKLESFMSFIRKRK